MKNRTTTPTLTKKTPTPPTVSNDINMSLTLFPLRNLLNLKEANIARSNLVFADYLPVFK